MKIKSSSPTVLDFGTCRTGSVHNRTVNILNIGAMDSNRLVLEADPSDTVLCSSFNTRGHNSGNNSGHNSGHNSGNEAGGTGRGNSHWEKIASNLGFQFLITTDRTDGVVAEGHTASMHVRFTAKTPQYNMVNNVTLRLRLKYECLAQQGVYMYKSFLVHGRVDSAKLMLRNNTHMPIKARGLEFPLTAVGGRSEEIIYLTNKGSFDAHFFISNTALQHCHEAFTIKPMNGTVPPHSTIKITVHFTPINDGATTALLRIRTNAAAPPSMGGGGGGGGGGGSGGGGGGGSGGTGDAYGSNTQILETRMSGCGGSGKEPIHHVQQT